MELQYLFKIVVVAGCAGDALVKMSNLCHHSLRPPSEQESLALLSLPEESYKSHGEVPPLM